MSEDEAFDELEARLKRQAQARETENLSRASVAAAEFISTQPLLVPDLLVRHTQSHHAR